MNHLTKLAFSALFAVAGSASAAVSSASVSVDDRLPQRLTASSPFERTALLQREHHARMAASKGISALHAATMQGEGMDAFDDFGWMTAPDGDVWYYAINLRRTDLNADNPSATYKDYTITGFSLTVYDGNANIIGKVNAEIPLLEDEIRIAQLDVSDIVTRKFFNLDNSYEVMVMVNANTTKYVNNVRTYAFSLTDDDSTVSEPVTTMDGMMVASIDASLDQWSESFFLIFDQEGYAASDGTFVPASEGTSADGVSGQRFTIYKKAGYSTPPAEIAYLDVTDDEANYNDGLPILVRKKDKTLYIAKTGYEKPFLLDPYDYENMTITPDNHFFVSLYSLPLSTYGTPTLSPVSTTRVPVEASTDEDVPLRFYGVGNLGYMDDMEISDDGTPQYVVTFSDYHISTDGSFYSYYTYDAEGNLTATIFENAEGRVSMSDVPGCPSQELFLTRSTDDVYTFNFVDMDTYKTVLSMPAAFGENTLTTAIDRVPTADGSYEYAVRMGVTELNSDGHLCECINWFRPDGSFSRQRLLYLGSDVAMAVPNITGQTLNPFFVNTDDQREYLFLVQRYTGVSSKTHTELLVLNDANDTVLQVSPGEGEGTISRVWTFGDGAAANMVIVYRNADSEQYRAEILPLPLTSFAGGSGTESDPYLVATAGDLQQMQNNPTAHYRLACDIDATPACIKGSGAEFSGTFDGNHKVIQNLRITGDNCSLFGTVVGNADATTPQIADFSVVNAALLPTSQNTCALLASSSLMHVGIENVHVYGLQVADDAFNGSFGGLVGSATVYTSIKGCSVNDADVRLPKASVAGGIAAQLRTTSEVKACKVSGNFQVANTLGGVVGEIYESSSLCSVTDCHVSADLQAEYAVGGVVGSDNHNNITHNYADVALTATGGDKWNGVCMGGVVGSLDAGMSGGVKGNVVALRGFSYEEFSVPEGGAAYVYETVHRVVGKSTYNESGMTADNGIADNHVLGDIAAVSTKDVYAGASGAEGADLSSAAFTADFLETLGYAFGNETAKPWTFTAAPALYFEGVVQGLMPAERTVEVEEGSTGHLSFLCAGGTGDDISIEIPENACIEVNYTSTEGAARLLVFDAVTAGEVVVTATCGALSAQCIVRVTDNLKTEIAAVSTEVSTLKVGSGSVVAGTDAPIALYDASGRRVATGVGSVSTASLCPGIYVAKSGDAAVKFVVK